MINKQFAIGTYEIQLLAKDDIDYIFTHMKDIATYIDTAINYNNDYCLSKYHDYKIISKIASCHFSNYELFVSNHLKCLNRDTIDIMLIHSNRGDWLPLAKKMMSDKRFKHTGVSNFSVSELELFYKTFNCYPEYNEIEINPSYVDIDTIQFCRKHHIKIIAYCILGGKYNAMKFVATYSLPYLVGFASNYADIVILKSTSITQVNDFIDAVKFYDTANISFETFSNNKVMQPMVYTAPTLQKRYAGELTYSIACAKNTISHFKSKEKVDIVLPEFEMLGDYLTYLRYLFKQDYSKDVYDCDFLIGDDGYRYAMYLYDSHNNLTKVNDNSKKEVIRLEIL